jgi:hypothetical protein
VRGRGGRRRRVRRAPGRYRQHPPQGQGPGWDERPSGDRRLSGLRRQQACRGAEADLRGAPAVRDPGHLRGHLPGQGDRR